MRRPPGFYAHLMENETKQIADLPEGAQQLLRPFEACKKELISYTHANPVTDLVPAAAWTGKIQGIGLSASAALSQIPLFLRPRVTGRAGFPQG